MLLSEMLNTKIKAPDNISLFNEHVSDYDTDSILNLSESQIEILSEEYFGKSTNLIKISKYFDEIISMSKLDGDGSFNKYVNKKETEFYKKIAPLVVKISKHVEDEFNFDNVGVVIQNTGSVTAFTLKFSNNLKRADHIKENTIVSKDGLKFKEKRYGMSTVIDRRVFDIDGITGEHVTAILLHEIGHQFYFENSIRYRYSLRDYLDIMIDVACSPSEVVNKMGNMVKANKPLQLGITIATKNIIERIISIEFLNNLAKSTKDALKLDLSYNKYISGALFSASQAIKSTQRITDVIMNIKSGSILLPIRGSGSHIKNVITATTGNTRYTEEQFCDNFATSYGYGSAFMEAISLIDSEPGTDVSNLINKGIGFNILYNSYMDLDKMLFLQNGVHPTAITRIIDQIKYVEVQLENNKNHPMYNQMKDDLNNMKNSYEKIKSKTASFEKKSDAITRGKIFMAITNMLNIAIGGDVAYQLHGKAYNSSGDLNAFKR